MKKILVIGGAGYIGTMLCNQLVKYYKVICLDNFWFGDFLNSKVNKIKKDLRNIKDHDIQGVNTVINLAYLSNDPLCEIDARYTWETGPLATYTLLEKCKKAGVKKFIFASSGSVYGIKKQEKVTENLDLNPITDYNKSKMICEKVIESYKDNFIISILRPATVCGYSKRLRLDVVLNLFVYQAYFKKKITVLGGNQIRPIIHMDDMIRAYVYFIKKDIKGTFNVGSENIKVIDLAKKVSKIINCKIEIKKTNDPRSYRMNSDKLISKGFEFQNSIVDAILDLEQEFKNGFKPTLINWNLNWLLNQKIIKKN